jgi:hypothetical protein
MLYRNASIFAFACMLGAAGCRDNGNVPPVDLSMGGGGGGGGGGGTGDMASGMKNYTVTTIAMMRQGAPGDYELDDVIAIGVTPSGSHMYAQDALGGDFSAVKANCSSTSGTHPCTVQTTVKGVAANHKVTLKGTYIKAKTASGGTEDFYIDSITDNGAGTAPAAAMVALTDVQQSSVAMAATTAPTNKKFWFQHVTVTTPGTLTMYDLSPSVFKNTQAGATCALWYGWGVAPSGTAGANTMNTCDASCATNPPGGACAQPTGVAVNAAEVLVGTDFYTAFKNTSDCKCYSKFSDPVVTSSSMTTKLGGILIYDTVFGSTPVQPYVYLAPLDNTNDVAF